MSSSVQSSEPVGGLDPDVGSVDPAAKPVRRSFTAEYRARVVAEYAAAPHGEKSAVLRREGLYQSQIREWTDARDAIVRGLVPKRNSHHRSGKPTQIKISGCHRSERGARAWLTVRAHISTLRKNGINILDGIRDSITGQPWQPAPG